MPQAISEANLKLIKGTTPREVLKDVRKMKRAYGRSDLNAMPSVDTVKPVVRVITEDERREIEAKLQRLLVWVGVMTPEYFEMDGRKLPLHDIVWDLLAKDCLTEEEKKYVGKLIRKLKLHVMADEAILHSKDITMEEAKEIYREAAGLMRAIMNLKSVMGEKQFCTIKQTQSRRRIEDAQNWLNFLKQIV